MLTVVFDLGGVLASLTSQVPDAAALLEADEAAAGDAYWANREPWDLGCSDLDYWGAVGRDLGLPVDADLAGRLIRRDVEVWTTLRPAAERLLADVHATGTPTWLLSNAATSLGRAAAARPWSRHLDGMVISGDERLTKPDERIYRIVEERTGASGDQLCFVDDRADNVAAAAALGWQTHLWRDDDATRAWLVGLGVLGA